MSSNHRAAGLLRRQWLVAAPAGLLALSVAAHRWWASRSVSAAGRSPGFASLTPGAVLEHGAVVRVHPLHLGAVPVVLSTASGHRYQVDVLARDPQGPPGVANTEQLSLYVVNSGDRRGHDRHGQDRGPDGQRPTDEDQGLGALSLAEALAEVTPPSGLLTLDERHRRHPDGIFAVPLV